MKPGVTRSQVEAELQTLMAAYQAATPEANKRHGIVVANSGRLPASMRLPFSVFVVVLFTLTGGLLAIACSNVAGMLLARATGRRREIATRLAIGASRGQLIAQLMTETLVLFLMAAVAAVPVAFWLSGLLQSFLPAFPVPIAMDWTVGWRAIGFAVTLALAAATVFGLAPARHALRTDLAGALHGHASTSTRERLRLRHTLVIAQVALSLTMVVTAGLFVRTLLAANDISPGFRISNMDVVTVDTTLAGAEDQAAVRMIDRVVEALRTVPGVEHVAHSRMVPLQQGGMGLGGVRIPGLGDEPLMRVNNADWDVVSPDFFTTLGIHLRDGRVFSADDRDGRTLVAVVNETFAKTAWPGQSAVGQRFWQTDGGTDEGRPLEVVGVVADAKYRSISEAAAPYIYDATAFGLLPQRIAAWVAGSVGVIGLFLAALGLYGLTAFLVAQRTREIAIRMALGATHGQVLSMVLRQAGRLGVIGGAVGLVLATGLGRVVQSLSLLVEVQPSDPLTVVGTLVVMAGVLLLASLYPARRAARTNPAMALRAE